MQLSRGETPGGRVDRGGPEWAKELIMFSS